MDTIIGAKELKWLGHIRRMDVQGTSKQVLYGESEVGKRKVESSKLKYIEQIKSAMKQSSIHIDIWQRLSLDRPMWRIKIRNGSISSEDRRIAKRWQSKRDDDIYAHSIINLID